VTYDFTGIAASNTATDDVKIWSHVKYLIQTYVAITSSVPQSMIDKAVYQWRIPGCVRVLSGFNIGFNDNLVMADFLGACSGDVSAGVRGYDPRKISEIVYAKSGNLMHIGAGNGSQCRP